MLERRGVTVAFMRLLLGLAFLVGACGSSENPDTALGDSSSADTSDAVVETTPDVGCSATTCVGDGKSCRKGVCVQDCRPKDSNPCPTGAACDYGDGKCKDKAAACFTTGVFDPCPNPSVPGRACGPGTMCDGKGSCVAALGGCIDQECDDTGRCWGKDCPCDRPAPFCTPAPLTELNRADFVGSLVNGADGEGAFDLDFDDICTAYTATMISGPDYLRQLTPAGVLTEWKSTTNLNMGQVAVLKIPGGEFKDLGDVAASYICCAACGCVETGTDGRLGIIHLDRTSATRPLPNVLPAKSTSGAGPFKNSSIDTGPYGLVWGPDKALYAGNVDVNGDFQRLDLVTSKTTTVTKLASRITAAAVFDLRRLLVATEDSKVVLLELATGTTTPWATLAGPVTSMRRDRFTGRVYAEINSTVPDIVEISADGATVTSFAKPPRIGRITIAPDGHVYHLSVFPNVGWKAKTAVVRFPLPAKR